ncbi:MAG: PUR family DNA/RNA-binding protein, partial [Flavobacteriaceae bacterium]
MSDNLNENQEEIYSKVLRAGRRTYFFDVRETKASDYYLTITESKKFTNDDGSFYYKKHKIYVYKEDFENFSAFLNETMNFIFEQRGVEVISERHQK